MKGDAVIRVPRASWKRAREFADRSKPPREMRELTATALDEYIRRQDGGVSVTFSVEQPKKDGGLFPTLSVVK